MQNKPLARPGLIAHSHALAALASCRATPYVLTDERGRDDDVPHIELIDRVMAQLQGARESLLLHRFAKADGYIEEVGRLVRELEDLPCGGAA